MAGGVPRSVGRLLARAGRPAVNPWALPSAFDAIEEVSAGVRRVSAPPSAHVERRPAPGASSTAPPEPMRRASGAGPAPDAGVPARIDAEPPPPGRPAFKHRRALARPERTAVVERPSRPEAAESGRAPVPRVEPEPLRPRASTPAGASATVPVPPGPEASSPATSFANRVPARPPSTQPASAADAGGRPVASAAEPRGDADRSGAAFVLRTAPPPERTAPGPASAGVYAAPFQPEAGGGRSQAPEQAAASAGPTVVIDEIRIVTPPTPVPPADPLASLAARRVGASRHRGGAPWPA